MTTRNVLSPFDLESIGEIQVDDGNTLESSLEQLVRTFKQESVSLHNRVDILQKLLDNLRPKRDQIAMNAVKEGGKPLRDSLVEVDRGLNGIELAIQSCHSMGGDEIPMGMTPSSVNRRAFTIRKPIGPIAAISAFNHPFNLAVHQIIPAVITGCPVLFKPDLRTPFTSQILIEGLYEAGLPEIWCKQVNLENELSEKLACDSRIQYLNFIGSGRVGWKLRSSISPGTRLTLEHGGVAPIIIDKDYKIASVVEPIIKSSFYHAGQVCVSTQKIYVHRNQLEEFVNQLSKAISFLEVGDPSLESTDVGPLIEPQELVRIDEWISEAKDKGAKLLLGGNKISKTCYQPSLLLNLSDNSKLANQEAFGPVLSIHAFDQINEAIEEINSLPYSFQSSIFTNSLDQAWLAIEKLNAGTLLVNDHTAFRVDWMPFSGKKQSGLGTGGIIYTMKDMTEEKLLVFKSPEIDL